jgi:hypothetical protein
MGVIVEFDDELMRSRGRNRPHQPSEFFFGKRSWQAIWPVGADRIERTQILRQDMAEEMTVDPWQIQKIGH